MKIEININEKQFNRLLFFIGEQYIYPTDKKTQRSIRMFVAKTMAVLGVEGYEGFNTSDFYEWISKKIAKKFKLKIHQDFK